MKPSARALLMTLGLLSIGAHAADPKDYVAPRALSDIELERMKENSRSSLNRYGRGVSDQPEPFPWLAFTLGIITLAALTPFAWRAYRGMARELQDSGAGSVSGPERSPEE